MSRIRIDKYEPGAFDEDAQAADLIQEYEARIGVHQTMIHQWKQALLDGASEIFQRGRSPTEPEGDRERIKDHHRHEQNKGSFTKRLQYFGRVEILASKEADFTVTLVGEK